MAQSMKSPSKAKTASPPTANGNTVGTDAKTAASNAATKSAGTASILKSTLRRMTRLSINTTSTKEKSSESNKASPEERNGRPQPSRRSTSMNRSGSFREPEPYGNGRIIPRNMPLSSSLRRPRNKDKEQPDYRGFQRSGTGGTLERRGVNRSQSVTGRSRQNRDTIVRKSRAIQTQLTRDSMNDDFENVGGGNENCSISTSVDFSLHMPDLLGAEVDPVETHYVEPSEPVDVRKNRELTLTNMRLQREVERLKLQIGDGEALKKEARTAKCKLEEERKARLRIEAELDRHV